MADVLYEEMLYDIELVFGGKEAEGTCVLCRRERLHSKDLRFLA